ncbi:MAG: hypothetical protein LM522_02190 [Candidatus Contendobacter sp.]|nr:hypothetical protein [Candidatus Contendobacter sp.]
MLSPHLIKGKEAQQVVVIRHPADQPPSGVRHEVVAVIGTLPPQPRVAQRPEIARLMTEAATWIETAPPEADLEPLADFGARHRRLQIKAGYAQARQERAALVRALRNGVSREDLAKIYGPKRVADVVMAYKRLNTAPPPLLPSLSRVRRALESVRDTAERQASEESSDPRYWAGRAALARELLALWPDGQELTDVRRNG